MTKDLESAAAASRTIFTFTGRFEPAGFLAFAAHRAARLDLTMTPIAASPEQVVTAVTGPDPLIDAFEMACSLGPIDCLVADVARTDG